LVTQYWSLHFHFLTLLCPRLGCALQQDLEDSGAGAGVIMVWWLALNGVATIAGESKTQRVLAHHSAVMEGLAQLPCLGWANETGRVSGGRAIVLNVSCFYCFFPPRSSPSTTFTLHRCLLNIYHSRYLS
jgi:hypothetical protein